MHIQCLSQVPEVNGLLDQVTGTLPPPSASVETDVLEVLAEVRHVVHRAVASLALRLVLHTVRAFAVSLGSPHVNSFRASTVRKQYVYL